jgi:hypothetical protein
MMCLTMKKGLHLLHTDAENGTVTNGYRKPRKETKGGERIIRISIQLTGSIKKQYK